MGIQAMQAYLEAGIHQFALLPPRVSSRNNMYFGTFQLYVTLELVSMQAFSSVPCNHDWNMSAVSLVMRIFSLANQAAS